jgi:hypothetical protein
MVRHKKHPVTGSPVGENNLLMRGQRRMARIVQANRPQITVQYNSGVQNSISEHTIKPCHGWAITAD